MIFSYINSLLNSRELLLFIEFFSCIIKVYLFIFLILKGAKFDRIQKQLLLLLTVLICSILVDVSWLVGLIPKIWFPYSNYRLYSVFIIRIAWAVHFILFLSLGFFLESLCERNYQLKLRHTVLMLLGIPWVAYFLIIAFINFTVTNMNERPTERLILQLGTLLIPIFLVIPSLYITIKKIKSSFVFPKILKKQLKILILYLISPYLITQLMDSYSVYHNKPYLIIGLSNLFLAFAIYFSITKIIKLRFLNFSNNIQSPQRIQFIDHFKNFLASITQAKSINEISFIIKTFFKESLAIEPTRVTLYCRQIAFETPHMAPNAKVATSEEAVVERLINNSTKNHTLLEYMHTHQILFYDEIEFTNFYQEEFLHKDILNFLDELKADIFLPIYEQNNLIAYIVITKGPQSHKELFSNLEHDQMVILASYLGHLIAMLQLNNYTELLKQNKTLQEHVYQSHQQNSQYRESIQSFLRDNKQRQTGILFYKNHHFNFGNQAAKELIPININIFDGHPTTRAIKKLVKQVEEYKTSQTTTVLDSKNNALVLTAIPHLEKNNIIITAAYPEISDVIKQQINNLKNPSEWEYLLYLQTTQSGKLINRLIPGSNPLLLNFKIELLKAALSKKAVLLDLPEDDLEPTAEILHTISLREKMHKLTMNSSEKNGAIAVKLFGVNPLFGVFEQALLEQLNPSGTLFIQNIHLLEIATQDALAEFIKYGYYTVCKSNKRIFANVRIVCSTSHNLGKLVVEEKFSKNLFEELRQTTIIMPSLFNLSQEELDELIKEFSQLEVSNTNNFQKLLEFTARDKEHVLKMRSLSLNSFRKKINQILIEKSKKHEIYHNVTFDPASHIADPDLAEAARLGKNALRDRKLLVLLMEKFDNNQNKVAAFLGVNRSSINRRLKAYKIDTENSQETMRIHNETTNFDETHGESY